LYRLNFADPTRVYPQAQEAPLEASWGVHVEARGVPWWSVMDEDNETAPSKLGFIPCFIHYEVPGIECNLIHLGALHSMRHLVIKSA